MAGMTKDGWTRTSLTLADDAMTILKREAQHERAYGAFVTQLLREYDRRQQATQEHDAVARLQATLERLEAEQAARAEQLKQEMVDRLERVEAACLTTHTAEA
jgi:phage terminase Nu1 subunit (DNA packaging protein)